MANRLNSPRRSYSMALRDARGLLLIVVVVLGGSDFGLGEFGRGVQAQTQGQPPPAQAGQWSGPFDWGITSMSPDLEIAHAAVLLSVSPPKVLLWYFETGPQTTETILLDPATPSVVTPLPQTLAANIFCSSHSFLPDGKLIVCGGSVAPFPSICCHAVPAGQIVPPGYPGSSACANNATFTFDPSTMVWTQGPNMAFSRFYSSQTTTSTGRPMVIGGTLDELCPTPIGPMIIDPALPPNPPPQLSLTQHDAKFIRGWERYDVPAGGPMWTGVGPSFGIVDSDTSDAYPFWPDFMPGQTDYLRWYPRVHGLAKTSPFNPA